METEKENTLEPCILCGEEISVDKVTVGPKGINTLIDSSKKWNDNISKLLSCENKVSVHGACRKKYTDPRKIAAGVKMRESRRCSLRTVISTTFDFKVWVV